MSTDYRQIAEKILKDWKGDKYTFGTDVLDAVGNYTAGLGGNALVVSGAYGSDSKWIAPVRDKIIESLKSAGVEIAGLEPGARPNAPREDVYRIALRQAKLKADCIVAIGGGSTIDAAKAAGILNSLDVNDLEPFFGVDQVAVLLQKEGRTMLPVIAVQTASSSAAHLTKYSNITDPASGTKKLVVDEAIVPPAAVFDYSTTLGSPASLTLDGSLDGIAHCWEVFMGATGKSYFPEMQEMTIAAMNLIFSALPTAIKNPNDLEARIDLGLGTDLGGYAIMIAKKNEATGSVEKGGTNGGHLGSFQLIHYLSHGRACAVLNPYYTVLFADAIRDQNLAIAPVLAAAGLIDSSVDDAALSSRKLAEYIAAGMIEFSKRIAFPTTLKEAGVPHSQIDFMVKASSNPQLKMKLQNMPTPLDPEKGEVDSKMGPTLAAAYSGDLSLIP